MLTIVLSLLWVTWIILFLFDSRVVLKNLRGLVIVIGILFILFDYQNLIYYTLLFSVTFFIVNTLSNYDNN